MNVSSFEDQRRVIKMLTKNDKTYPDIIFTFRFCGVKWAQTFNMITTLATIAHKKLKPHKITTLLLELSMYSMLNYTVS